MSNKDHVLITTGPHRFLAVFESSAPKTSSLFRSLLPRTWPLIHVRWSGEAVWVPMGDTDFGLGYENNTAHPSKGQILLYPGGFSETELLVCYGGVAFASKMGPLSANHFLTIIEGGETLPQLGNEVLWKGAQETKFELADEKTIAEFRRQREKYAKSPAMAML